MTKQDNIDDGTAAIKAFTEYIARIGDSECKRYASIALNNNDVQQHIKSHANRDESADNVICLPTQIGARIVFIFKCNPPRICIIPPAFLVKIDTDNEVFEITDPYVIQNNIVLQEEGRL
ncbi:MAG TPA: hypothetical protein VJ697_00195 [Nitrososphaeraceae archaeon]|nr:hypothetical protein [Nitrososphaeraceae archaeon]